MIIRITHIEFVVVQLRAGGSQYACVDASKRKLIVEQLNCSQLFGCPVLKRSSSMFFIDKRRGAVCLNCAHDCELEAPSTVESTLASENSVRNILN